MDRERTAYARLRNLVRSSLLTGKAEDAAIDAALRQEAEIRSATAWVLMLAILIASIGLNTNSTAVIIGAMLVSPLMGPIIGVGYGVGIYDFGLVRKSLGSLGRSMAISLATSALYFALSPLTGEQSELLARTSPTIWDVQIALFGGLAGIIGLTRQEKSNVIPGVAIATALMPPLCTAGFGLASANWRYFFGAFYLFAINSVFIALAATLGVWAMKLPRKAYVDPVIRARVKRGMLVVALLTALPSLYLATRLVGEELYDSRGRAFVRQAFAQTGAHVVDTRVDAGGRRLTVTLVGDVVPQATLQDIRARLAEAGLAGTTLEVFQTRDPATDLALRSGKADKAALLALRQALEDNQKTVAQLNSRLAEERVPWLEAAPDITRELLAQRPELRDVVLSAGRLEEPGSGDDPARVAVLNAVSPVRLRPAERKRLEAWLLARTQAEAVRVHIEVVPAKKPARRRG